MIVHASHDGSSSNDERSNDKHDRRMPKAVILTTEEGDEYDHVSSGIDDPLNDSDQMGPGQ
jgi:hypothetical protein